MQVILKKDIPQIGRIGDLVKVREGYARNFLIPRHMAVAASASNAKALEHQKRLVEFHKKKVSKESELVAEKLGKVSVKLKRRLNESGKLFGSVGPSEISQELLAQGFTYDRRDIELDPIKVPGSYSAKVRLPGDVFVDIKVLIEDLETDKEKKASAAKKSKKDTSDSDSNIEASAANTEADPDSKDAKPAKKASKKSAAKSKSDDDENPKSEAKASASESAED